jgi:hypothetical protein
VKRVNGREKLHVAPVTMTLNDMSPPAELLGSGLHAAPQHAMGNGVGHAMCACATPRAAARGLGKRKRKRVVADGTGGGDWHAMCPRMRNAACGRARAGERSAVVVADWQGGEGGGGTREGSARRGCGV